MLTANDADMLIFSVRGHGHGAPSSDEMRSVHPDP
jgi:hypothetical protein